MIRLSESNCNEFSQSNDWSNINVVTFMSQGQDNEITVTEFKQENAAAA